MAFWPLNQEDPTIFEHLPANLKWAVRSGKVKKLPSARPGFDFFLSRVDASGIRVPDPAGSSSIDMDSTPRTVRPQYPRVFGYLGLIKRHENAEFLLLRLRAGGSRGKTVRPRHLKICIK